MTAAACTLELAVIRLPFRRQLCLSASAVLLAPAPGRAAPARRVGVLRSETGIQTARPLLDALASLGYKVGEDLEVHSRVATLSPQAFQQSADELVRLNIDVLVAISTPAALAALKATTSIPIVMVGSPALVEQGYAGSLARPGGSLTGVTSVPDNSFFGKQLALLKEAAPKVTRVAVVLDASFHTNAWTQFSSTARTLGIAVFAAPGDSFDELALLLRKERADALLALPTAQVNATEQRLAKSALAQRLPSMFGTRTSVSAGGLMSYWTSWADLGRKAAHLVDKILKGRKPAELPFEQPTRFDLYLNLTTAKALGLNVPRSLLVQCTDLLQ